MVTSSHSPRPRLTLLDRVFAWRYRLPRPFPYTRTPLRIPLRDGVELGADLYTPSRDPKGLLLARGPYGRGNLVSLMQARVFAAQGYAVLFVSSRGTADSAGSFDPSRTERVDGVDIVAWMRKQLWYPGRFATIGASYLGFTQWALLADQPEDLVTAVILVGPHDFSRHTWGSGNFNLDFIGWSDLIVLQSHAAGPLAMLRLATAARRLRPILEAKPIADAVQAHFDGAAPWVQERLVRPALTDEFWRPTQLAAALDTVTVPVLLLSGWQDLFIQQTFEQYARLSARGVEVGLTVGPWTHIAIAREAAKPMTQQTLAWLDEKMAGAAGPARQQAVRFFVTGANEWREAPSWPPLTRDHALFLEPGMLRETRPEHDAADVAFVFDPDDPTPTVGGPLISGGGYVDDSRLARRKDVAAYTGPALAQAWEVIGTVRLSLAHVTEHPDADLFVRLSDIDPRGRSTNVTEGFIRLPARRNAGAVVIELSPTAHRFERGHQIRIVVAGGSFPQFAPNPGTGENPLTAARRNRNRHTIMHSDGRSTLMLPLAAGSR